MCAISPENPANVLLVDDTPANLQVLGGMLKDQGCIVRPVPSGKLAIRFAEADPPDIILLDIMMPEMDGYEVCRRLKQKEELREIPVIFISALQETVDKVKAFSAGGVDFITKPFQFEEVEARVRTHLDIRRLQVQLERQNRQLTDLNQALSASRNALERELANAANYVVSLIPPAIPEGDIQTDWLYVPSAHLGGDALGYHWIDDAHFALYLLDVSGHGVGPALLSVSVLNTLRTRSLPETDFLRPAEVLSALNACFPMSQHNGQYFTIWYGVFDRKDRMLRYASGGHPPALLFDGSNSQPVELDTQSLPIGLFPETQYCPGAVRIRPASTVYLYSDGCYEIRNSDGEVGNRQEWVRYLTEYSPKPKLHLDAVYRDAIRAQGSDRLDDDFSILRATFA